MKKLLVVILAAVAVISASTVFAAESNSAKVIAYYFHGSFRCYTCTNMEKYTREAIEAGFSNELRSGKLEFKAINVEERGNGHFVHEYQLYTKSLVLSLVRAGKQVKWKNLDKIWQLSGNKKKFTGYVVAEIAGLLKEAQ